MRPLPRSRLVAIALSLVIVTIAGLWIAFVRAPGPTAVCQHIIELTMAEAGGASIADETQQALLDQMRARCIVHKRDKLQLRGRIAYARYAKCVLRAQNLMEIEGC